MTDPPTDFDRQPTSGAHLNPRDSLTPGQVQLSPEVIATLPMWVKAVIVLAPIVTGALSGVLGGGAAAAQERAVLTAKVDRLEDDQREMREDVARRIDRLTDLLLKRSD